MTKIRKGERLLLKESSKKGKIHLSDGIFRDNTVLSSLMVISPVIVCGDTLVNATAVVCIFSLITFVSVVIASFIPKRLPYCLRAILCAVISSLVYIPVKIFAQEFYPGIIPRLGIYFPLLALNSVIILQTGAKFSKMKKSGMLVSLLSYIVGFDLVIILTAFVRELLAYGTIDSRVVNADFLVSGMGTSFGGFIFLGLLCGLYRKIRRFVTHGEDPEGEENVSCD